IYLSIIETTPRLSPVLYRSDIAGNAAYTKLRNGSSTICTNLDPALYTANAGAPNKNLITTVPNTDINVAVILVPTLSFPKLNNSFIAFLVADLILLINVHPHNRAIMLEKRFAAI